MGDTSVSTLKSNPLMDCLDINGIENIIQTHTCFKWTPSLIKLCITNKPKRLQQNVSLHTNLSDVHNMICAATRFHVPTHKAANITYRSYTNVDEK